MSDAQQALDNANEQKVNVDKLRQTKDTFEMIYQDSNGDRTKRMITLKTFLITDQKAYIFAYCFLRNTVRQFNIERIMSLKQEGKSIKNPQQYLLDLYKESDQFKTLIAINDNISEVFAMVFISRSDGIMKKNERDIIISYLKEVSPNIEESIADEMIKKIEYNLEDFLKVTKEAPSWTTEAKERFLRYGEQIIALKKTPDIMEVAAFEKLKLFLV